MPQEVSRRSIIGFDTFTCLRSLRAIVKVILMETVATSCPSWIVFLIVFFIFPFI